MHMDVCKKTHQQHQCLYSFGIHTSFSSFFITYLFYITRLCCCCCHVCNNCWARTLEFITHTINIAMVKSYTHQCNTNSCISCVFQLFDLCDGKYQKKKKQTAAERSNHNQLTDYIFSFSTLYYDFFFPLQHSFTCLLVAYLLLLILHFIFKEILMFVCFASFLLVTSHKIFLFLPFYSLFR